ncbi:MAG: ECF transporter S component [Clostridiales bacterium]|nr:ECF transporter S component [Clostridiales bacterium]
MRESPVVRLVLCAMFIALGFLLPFLTGQIPTIGSMLSPMHIPALLCGFICGWPWGLAAGFVMPLLRSLILGMPPLMPVALAMAFEMAVYGAAAGLLYKLLGRSSAGTYAALVLSMLLGRLMWGLAMAVLVGSGFGWQAFAAGAFLKAWPGILLHILIIPPILFALKRARLIPLAD